MSGGKIRSHKNCMKSKKYNPNSKICEVCGWTQKVHKTKLFQENEETSSLKEIQELVDCHNLNLRIISPMRNRNLDLCREKAQKYKEILSKGCGKDCNVGLISYICGKTKQYLSPKDDKYEIFFCSECKEKLKLINEVLE